MGIFDTALQSDAEFSADTDQFSESCTYTRANATTATVRVVIDRNPPVRDSAYSINTRPFDIWIPYSSDYGLTAKPDEGDTITLKDDPADAGTTVKTLSSILTSDAGGWLCVFS